MKRDEGNKGGGYNPPLLFDDKGRWTKVNYYEMIAIYSVYKLSTIEVLVLQYVYGYCDRQANMIHQTSAPVCPLSYSSMASKLCCSLAQSKKSIKHLLELKLMECVSKGKGHKRSCYAPNYKLVRKLKKQYLEEVEEDRDTSKWDS